MRILLTGSSGLIGSAVYAAISDTHEVIRLGRSASQSDHILDLTNPQSSGSLPECDVLIHCAGVVDEDFGDNSLKNMSSVLMGADFLANSASKAGAKRAVYVSSSHVYGQQIGTIVESSMVNPLSYYSMAHYCTEQLFKKYFSGINQSTLILRPNAVYGILPHPRKFTRWTLIPFSFPLEAWRFHTITLKSSGSQRRNFVSSTSVAKMILDWLSISQPVANTIYHPVGHVTESVFEFSQRCVRIAKDIACFDCKVIRPDNQLQSMAEFEYGSLIESCENENDLDIHIEYLLNLFQLNSDVFENKATLLFS